jgi:hypothetical protein
MSVSLALGRWRPLQRMRRVSANAPQRPSESQRKVAMSTPRVGLKARRTNHPAPTMASGSLLASDLR